LKLLTFGWIAAVEKTTLNIPRISHYVNGLTACRLRDTKCCWSCWSHPWPWASPSHMISTT